MTSELFYNDSGDRLHPIMDVNPSDLFGLPLYDSEGKIVPLSKAERFELGIPEKQPWGDNFSLWVSNGFSMRPIADCTQEEYDRGEFYYFHLFLRKHRLWRGPKPERPEHLKYDELGNEPVTPLFSSALDLLWDESEPEYLVHPLIEADSDIQLVGPSGEGKSFIAIDLAAGVVTGGVTFGGRQCLPGAVLYLAGEGHRGIRRRLRAYVHQYGLEPEDLKCFFVSNGTIDFEGTGLRESITEAKRIEENTGEAIRLIVIDTLARHMIGEENSAKDTGEFIRAVSALREAFPGSVTMTVHHTGHGEDTKGRGRGSSAVPAAMDSIIICNQGLLTFTKQKDGEIPQPIEFKLVPVEIGIDSEGKQITSCIVEYGERSQKHRAPVLTGQEKIIVRLLTDLESKSELIGDLRKRFYSYRQNLDPEVKANTMKNAYLKVIPSLIEKQIIRQEGNLISLITPETSPVTLPSFPVISDGLSVPSCVISPYKGDDKVTSQVTGFTDSKFEWATI